MSASLVKVITTFRQPRMFKLGIVLAAFVVFSDASVFAADSVRADAALDIAVLSGSSRLVAGHTDNAAIAAYATAETQALSRNVPSSSSASSADFEAIQTGRSAAVGARVPIGAVSPLDATQAAAGLATLNSLHGKSFDKLFLILQRDALLRLENDHDGAGESGDPVVKQIPALLKRLDALHL